MDHSPFTFDDHGINVYRDLVKKGSATLSKFYETTLRGFEQQMSLPGTLSAAPPTRLFLPFLTSTLQADMTPASYTHRNDFRLPIPLTFLCAVLKKIWADDLQSSLPNAYITEIMAIRSLPGSKGERYIALPAASSNCFF